jgi:ribonuclease HII
MRNLGLEYPQYGFAEHVGYATVGRRRALASGAAYPSPGARFDLSRKKNDPRAKKVSKGLKSNIL